MCGDWVATDHLSHNFFTGNVHLLIAHILFFCHRTENNFFKKKINLDMTFNFSIYRILYVGRGTCSIALLLYSQLPLCGFMPTYSLWVVHIRTQVPKLN